MRNLHWKFNSRNGFYSRLQGEEEEGWEMTDAELAKEIVDYVAYWHGNEVWAINVQRRIAAAFKRIREEAMKDEAVNCAKHAEIEYYKGMEDAAQIAELNEPEDCGCGVPCNCISGYGIAKRIAAAIRSRSGKKGEGV